LVRSVSVSCAVWFHPEAILGPERCLVRLYADLLSCPSPSDITAQTSLASSHSSHLKTAAVSVCASALASGLAPAPELPGVHRRGGHIELHG
jgi:hypothetical protein